MVPKIHIVRTADGADFPLPAYSSRHHAGLNLRAAIGGPIKINPRERVRIPVGFALAIPDGLCGQIVSFSPLALEHGVVVIDSPSLVNPGDREPLFVLLRNESAQQFILRRGMIIAQLLVLPVVQVAWEEVRAPQTSEISEPNELFVDGKESENQEEEQHSQIMKDSSKRVRQSIRDRGAKS